MLEIVTANSPAYSDNLQCPARMRVRGVYKSLRRQRRSRGSLNRPSLRKRRPGQHRIRCNTRRASARGNRLLRRGDRQFQPEEIACLWSGSAG